MFVWVLISENVFEYDSPTKSVSHQGNDFRHMALALGVSRSRYNAIVSFAYTVPRRSNADMAEDISYGCSYKPRKNSIHHLPRPLDLTKKRHPAC